MVDGEGASISKGTSLRDTFEYLVNATNWTAAGVLGERSSPNAVNLRSALKRRIGAAGVDTADPGLATAEVVLWPPDLFALVATVLRQSAGYLAIANAWPPSTGALFKLFGVEGVDPNMGAVSFRNTGVLGATLEPMQGEPTRATIGEDDWEQIRAAFDGYDKDREDFSLDDLLVTTQEGSPSDQRKNQFGLTNRTRKILYRHLVRSVARQWRVACRMASLATVNADEGVARGHNFHEPERALERVPDAVLGWVAKLLDNANTRISDIGRASRPPLSDRSEASLQRIMDECRERGMVEEEARAGLEKLMKARASEVERLHLAYSLTLLLVACDEVCVGMGVRVQVASESDPTSQVPDALLVQAASRLIYRTLDVANDRPASLCRRILSRRGVVLPKLRTPQTGMTIRSMSHHICHIKGDEAWAKWNLLTAPQGTFGHEGSLNLLLVPWPRSVRPAQFRRAADEEGASGTGKRSLSPEYYGFFEYLPDATEEAQLDRHVRSLLASARDQMGHIDGIVLPELSCSSGTLSRLAWNILAADEARLKDGRGDGEGSERRKFQPPGPVHLIVGGVLIETPGLRPDQSVADPCMAENAAAIYLRTSDVKKEDVARISPRSNWQYESMWYRQQQAKHHRWHIDGSQVVQYGLGGVLNPDITWVESINIPRRSLHFWMLAERLNLAVLVCEDLAQADPIGDVVRAVAPNLLIALLADGPQLGSRWSARYATSLASDPGTSVLTLTSRGMSKLSSPHSGADRSEVLGHWRDQSTGSRELVVPAESDGLVLSLHLRESAELSADGRLDSGAGASATEVVFGGSHPVTISGDDPATDKDPNQETLLSNSEWEAMVPVNDEHVAFGELEKLVHSIRESDTEPSSSGEGSAGRRAEDRIVPFVEALKRNASEGSKARSDARAERSAAEELIRRWKKLGRRRDGDRD